MKNLFLLSFILVYVLLSNFISCSNSEDAEWKKNMAWEKSYANDESIKLIKKIDNYLSTDKFENRFSPFRAFLWANIDYQVHIKLCNEFRKDRTNEFKYPGYTWNSLLSDSIKNALYEIEKKLIQKGEYFKKILKKNRKLGYIKKLYDDSDATLTRRVYRIKNISNKYLEIALIEKSMSEYKGKTDFEKQFLKELASFSQRTLIYLKPNQIIDTEVFFKKGGIQSKLELESILIIPPNQVNSITNWKERNYIPR